MFHLSGLSPLGYSFDLYLLDEPTRHDSTAITEMLALTLENVKRLCDEKGACMPRTLVLISDNTVREVKNQYCLSYVCNLVSRFRFRLGALLNLRKSHTHDRLDQAWGIFARRLASSDKLLSADSVLKILHDECHRPGMRAFIGLDTDIKISKLDAARSWRNHFKPQQKVTLSGGLLEDASGNHAFLCMTRRGWL